MNIWITQKKKKEKKKKNGIMINVDVYVEN